MIENSPKPVETENPHLYAVTVALAWLEQNGGPQRIPSALRHLLEATRTALERDERPPEKDSLTLGELWRLSRAGGSDSPVVALRVRDVEQWWASREAHLSQVCADHGSAWMPRVVVHRGGGRHHATRYSFAFVPLAHDGASGARDEAPPTPEVSDNARALTYRIDPAKPALWLRLLVGSRPFPINSWRGYLLLGVAALNFVLIGLMAYAQYVSWLRPRVVTTAELATLGLAVLVSAGLWISTRPVRELPRHRVTLAGSTYLALSELHGQLRTMHDPHRRLGGRVFSVVRHWGICPICSAEVDVDAGGAAFPDRLVGRCHDAPQEHVFSFDPVRLVGEHLRRGAYPNADEATGQ